MRPDATFDIFTAPKHNSRHWKPGTVTWGEITHWVDEPASTKECGNYLLGELQQSVVDHTDPPSPGCRNYHRRKGTVVSRSVVTLDIDYPSSGIIDRLEMLLPYAAVVHTTWRSAPDAPRYRVLIPADRSMSPEEYFAVADVLMGELGREAFDPGSAQPERYMYRPSAQERDWYQSWVIDGDAAPVTELVAKFDPDLSRLPAPKPHSNKRNPFELDGVVGAFNRTYGIQEAIEKYALPYEQVGARWQLVGALGEAGMSTVSEGLVYSHHATDPAAGQTCSAFDLVRLHRFAELDVDVEDRTPVNRRPSHQAMLDLAAQDPKVIADLVGVELGPIDDVLDDAVAAVDWKLNLRLNSRSGAVLDDIRNWDLIRKHDPVFSGLYYNELTFSIEADHDLPWRPLSRGGASFSDVDRAWFRQYLEREYKLRPPVYVSDELIDTTAHQRYVNPVRDYLEALTWDGVPRLEECLPGVEPTPYTRTVARKALVSAVARALDPGVKADYTLVLFGEEGKGKSWWIDKMSLGHSATLGRIGDKDTLLTMHRSWIMIADEGYSLRKGDSDAMKEFLTRREDVFRLPYERETKAHPRRCVIWGTTNDEVFLRRQEGNRRFLIVRCTSKVDFEALTDEYVAQVWAEAVAAYRSGERLYLIDDEATSAATERERFTEEDALGGVIQEYLDTPVPEEWPTMSADHRRTYLQNLADGYAEPGSARITEVCSAQVWVEALGRRFGDHKRSDLLDINTVLKRIPGWQVFPERKRLYPYGPQLVFTRKPDSSEVL